MVVVQDQNVALNGHIDSVTQVTAHNTLRDGIDI